MTRTLKSYILYSVFWLIYFQIIRLVFIVTNYSQVSEGPGISHVLSSTWSGLALDLSTMGYVLIIPLLVGIAGHYLPINIRKVNLIYTAIILGLFSLTFGIDLKLYNYWGFRFDATPLFYLETPKVALGSLTWGDFFIPIFAATCAFTVFYLLYRKFFLIVQSKTLASMISMLALLLLLFIPIRGGFDVAPMNVGRVYKSKNTFTNHASINVVWNLTSSMIEMSKLKPVNHELSLEEASGIMRKLKSPEQRELPIYLTKSNPDVLLILLESFSAKLMGTRKEGEAIIPNLEKLSGEGIYFNNVYSSGDRTDKGLVSIMSGYPSQPNNSIMKFPGKTRQLPHLISSFNNYGYTTLFHYAGDIDFANMRAYMNQQGVNKLVTKSDHDAASNVSKWGIHDHIMFDSLYQQISRLPSPYFATALTLSSHEPFDVPGESFINIKSREDQFLNAAHYTDKALGRFVELLKQTKKWSNLLLVIVADHGHRLPGNHNLDQKEKYHIPLLFTGGVVDTSFVVSEPKSQIDISSTLLQQLGMPSDDFKFSRNLFSEDFPFVYYAFNGGYGIISEDYQFTYNLKTKRVHNTSGSPYDSLVILGKGFFENVMYDFESR